MKNSRKKPCQLLSWRLFLFHKVDLCPFTSKIRSHPGSLKWNITCWNGERAGYIFGRRLDLDPGRRNLKVVVGNECRSHGWGALGSSQDERRDAAHFWGPPQKAHKIHHFSTFAERRAVPSVGVLNIYIPHEQLTD